MQRIARRAVMLTTIRNFLSLIRFSHTLFALPFAMLAALMAWRLCALEGGGVGNFVELDDNTFVMTYNHVLSIGPFNFSMDLLV
jgi:hypothetical protein